MFCNVCVHLGPFRYCTKLGAKQVKLVQLVQKFVPRRCVRIFRDKRTQSTQLDPIHMFWCVSYSLGAFGTVLLPYETNFKTGRTRQLMQKFIPRFGTFRTFWMCFGPFDYCTEHGAKWAKLVQLMQKFVPRRRVGIFRNECT